MEIYNKVRYEARRDSSSYVKLQDAYVAEKGTNVGSWFDIGYLMKNSSNFNYCNSGSAACRGSDNDDGYAGTKKTKATPKDYVASWNATSIATLNDCPAKSYWTLTTSQNGTEGGVVLYTAAISADDACSVLTPNFKNLDTAGSTDSDSKS